MNPKCCICGKECENEWGNNPDPLITDVNAKCCNDCNTAVVMFRIFLSNNDLTPEQIEDLRKRTIAEIKE